MSAIVDAKSGARKKRERRRTRAGEREMSGMPPDRTIAERNGSTELERCLVSMGESQTRESGGRRRLRRPRAGFSGAAAVKDIEAGANNTDAALRRRLRQAKAAGFLAREAEAHEAEARQR